MNEIKITARYIIYIIIVLIASYILCKKVAGNDLNIMFLMINIPTIFILGIPTIEHIYKCLRYLYILKTKKGIIVWEYDINEWRMFIKQEFRRKLYDNMKKFKKSLWSIPLLCLAVIVGINQNGVWEDWEKILPIFIGICIGVIVASFIYYIGRTIDFYADNIGAKTPRVVAMQNQVLLNGTLYEWNDVPIIIKDNRMYLNEAEVLPENIVYIKYSTRSCTNLNSVIVRFPIPEGNNDEAIEYITLLNLKGGLTLQAGRESLDSVS